MHEQTESVSAEGCEPVITDGRRLKLLWLMVEYFHTLGATEIRARLPGLAPPPVLHGTIEDHRPDFTCRQANGAKTPLILDVVTEETLSDPRADNRWSLFSSAAKLYQAELHLVVPKWGLGGNGDEALKRRLRRLDVNVQRVWAV